MSEFFAMGGYGAFVWPCVALSFAILAGLLFSARRRLSGARRQIRNLSDASNEGAWELRI
ncbi:heme exporter protein CcmD [Candidatus Foliamicus sp.]